MNKIICFCLTTNKTKFKTIVNKSKLNINTKYSLIELNQIKANSTMSSSKEPKRYFLNKMKDFEEKESTKTSLNIDLKSKILELSSNIWTNASKSHDHNDDNIYVGNVGISYLFLYLSKQEFFDQNTRNEFLQKSVSLITESIGSQPRPDKYEN